MKSNRDPYKEISVLAGYLPAGCKDNEKVEEERNIAKGIYYMYIYGGQIKTIAKTLDIKQKKASAYLDACYAWEMENKDENFYTNQDKN